LTNVPSAIRSRSGARWLLAAVAIIVVAVLVIVLTSSSSPPAGYDVSYPQCSGSYPSNQLFAIVGVDGGLASNSNPCLSDQLRWAQGAPGQKRPKQTRVSLYIDTGNPGPHVAKWPRGGTASTYGACNGLLTNACSFLYGQQQAARSYGLVAALDARTARTAPWWLDVELSESWAGTYGLNIAALRGFVAGLRGAGASGPLGVYSTSAQWKDITGLTAQTTPTTFNVPLLDWEAAAQATIADARQNCANGGFTGAAPALAQYQIGNLDADLRCTTTR
jgi:hypothetical protein